MPLTQLPRELPIKSCEVLRRSFANSCRGAAVASGRWLVIAVVLLSLPFCNSQEIAQHDDATSPRILMISRSQRITAVKCGRQKPLKPCPKKQRASSDFLTDENFARHKFEHHAGEAEYRKRVLCLMAETGRRPIASESVPDHGAELCSLPAVLSPR